MSDTDESKPKQNKSSRIPARFTQDTLALKCNSGVIILTSMLSALILCSILLLFLVFFLHGAGHHFYPILLVATAFGGILDGILDREERRLLKNRDIVFPLCYIVSLVMIYLVVLFIIFEPLKHFLENSGSEDVALQVNSGVLAFGILIITALLVSPALRIWKNIHFNLLELFSEVDPSLYYDLSLVESEFQKSQIDYKRYGHVFTLVLFDIQDHDRLVKEKGKHFVQQIIGDMVLRMHKLLRASDYVGRAEQGLFIAVLTNTPADKSVLAANRLIAELTKTNYRFKGKEFSVDFIFGAAEVTLERDTLAKMIAEATKNMGQQAV